MISIQLLTSKDDVIKALDKENDIKFNLINVEDLKKADFDLKYLHWYLVFKDIHPIGIVVISKFTDKIYKLHGGIYKQFRHGITYYYFKTVLQILHNKYPNTIFMSTVDEKNIKAIKILEKSGFHYKTVFPHGCPNNNNLIIYSEV